MQNENMTCEKKVYDSNGMFKFYKHIRNKRVLDIGCGTGFLGDCLTEFGNECYGITISPGEVVKAQGKMKAVHLIDIENAKDLPFKKNYFDVIVFGDVLEHLKNSSYPLQLVKPYLKQGGMIIVSLPNIANFKFRLRLLMGKFEYEPYGIMDYTHLRFFTLDTAKQLIEFNGYEIKDIQYTYWTWTLPKILAAYDWEIRTRLVKWWPNVFASQFVFYAYPIEDSPLSDSSEEQKNGLAEEENSCRQ